MFLFLALAAARTLVFKAHSENDLQDVEAFYKGYTRDISVSIDATIPKGTYFAERDNVKIDLNGKDEARKFLSMSEVLDDVPSEMPEIMEALKGKKADPIADLKTGSFSFAIFFTKDPKHLKELSGVEGTQGIKYFVSSNEELASKLGANFPSVLAYNASERNILKLPFRTNFASIHAAMSIDTLTRVNSVNIKHIQALDQKIFYIIDAQDKYAELKKTMGEELKAYSSEFKFIFFAPQEIPTLIKLIGAEDSHYPILLSMSKEGKHLVRNVKSDQIQAGIMSILTGTAEAVVLASPIPENNEANAVKVVNTHTVGSVIENKSIDRLVVVSSPNCGFCRALKPVISTLAEAIKSNSVELFIGEYNMIENEEFKHATITGVPTLFYIKKDSTELVKLPAEVRTIPTLVDFIAANGVSASINPADYKSLEEVKTLPETPEDVLADDSSDSDAIMDDADLEPIPANDIMSQSSKSVRENEIL